MDLQTAKLTVMLKIMYVSKASLLNKISNILDEEMNVAYTSNGRPQNKMQYDERLLIAEKEIESGDIILHDDLEKEIDTWQ